MGCAKSKDKKAKGGNDFDNAAASPSSGYVYTKGVNPVATFDTSMGTFKAELYIDKVPLTVSNFIDLCQTGFYNGIHFHRVISGFMNQFGCPYAKTPHHAKAGTGGPPKGSSYKDLKNGVTVKREKDGCIQDEFISKDSNVPGSLSMANTGQRNSGGSQMFFNLRDNSRLDWFSPGPSQHPVFGQIIEGMDVVERISNVPTQNDDPKTPIKMNSITIS